MRTTLKRIPELVTRRAFLETSTAVAFAAFASPLARLRADEPSPLGFPLVDFHVHLDNSSIDQVLPLSDERHVRFGVVEHAGTKLNKYPVVLSNDEELLAQIKKLEGKGVYIGVQAEWTDWSKCFSREALAKLDYVLTDSWTFPADKDGHRVKLWEKEAEEQIDMTNHEKFMDRYVDWNVEVLSAQPIDILANVSWLPAPLEPEFDALWTDERMQKLIDAAKKFGVAIEISSTYKLPKLKFLKTAKAAGLKFSFGSNGRYPNMGKLDYSITTAKELGLTAENMFSPAPAGQKAVERRL